MRAGMTALAKMGWGEAGARCKSCARCDVVCRAALLQGQEAPLPWPPLTSPLAPAPPLALAQAT